MASINDALAGQKTPLEATLDAGVESLSLLQEITFVKYVKVILPLDGYVFWVKADLLSPMALFNASQFNSFALNQSAAVVTPAAEIVAKGSLHYSTDRNQDETETIAVNRVIFTSEHEIVDFNQIGPTVMFLATFDGIQFTFSSRGSFYRQADLFHYTGAAIYSDMSTQVINGLDGFNSRDVIVSNSLPLWLALNNYTPPYPGGFANPGLMLYPSFLVPQNLTPPFASIHIDPASTIALGASPLFDIKMSQTQLAQDTVTITMYGMRNFNAQDFVACVEQYSLDFELFGVMNMPILRDEKRTQVELQTIAQKKSVIFQINYYQSRIRDVARQLILQAIPQFQFG